MAKQQGKLQDPVAAKKQELNEQKVEQEVVELDLSGLKFETIPDSRAKMPPPFEGYDYGPKVKIYTRDFHGNIIKVRNADGKLQDYHEVSTTFIVGVNPASEPAPDPSNLNYQVQQHKMKKVKVRDGMFDIMQPDGESKSVSLGTYHSRVLRCYEPPYSGDNYDVVFDREIVLDNGAKVKIAVVPQHSLRAQLAFFLNHKTDPPAIMVDKRYMFPDLRQISKLRAMFSRLIARNLSQEKLAAMVSGEIEATDEGLAKLPSEV